ncbi:cytochrome P450 [Aspergillus karnatakaensis]|uniref:cytochrome P450 n=1 Tax=Aspergillus karnatakaensis TaxID=1810916 RepID=UPI003CCCB349
MSLTMAVPHAFSLSRFDDVSTLLVSALSFILIPGALIFCLQLLQPGPVIKGVKGPLIGRFLFGLDTKLGFLSGKSAFKFNSLHRKYGNVVRFAPGQLSTNTIKSMRNIYGAGLGKSNTFLKTGFYKAISRRNIFTASDPYYHATVRKLFSPSLSPGCMAAHEDVIKGCISRFHALVKKRMENSKAISLNDLYYSLSVDMVSEVLIGKPLGCIERGRPFFWTEQLPRIFYWATIRDQFQGSGVPTLIKWMLRQILRKGIRQRSEEARMRLIREQLKATHTRRDIMVEVLERSESSTLPEDEIAENFSAIMLAGFHTTSHAICAAIWLVLSHPETHAELTNELRSAFASPEDVSLEILQKLPWLNSVITETLRIYPPVPLGGPRVSPGAYVDGVYVPAGVEICTSLYALHHNPEYFHEPSQFRPQRWINPVSMDKKEAVQPFLLGSRSCIAKYFAQQMMLLSLASFFVQFDGKYVGRVKDWTRDSRCYAFWELPDLKVVLQDRMASA